MPQKVSELQNLINKANECYNQGMAYKNIAIKGDENLKEFVRASEAYTQAANFANKALKSPEATFDFKILTEALKEYYLYEAGECSYGFKYKNQQFEDAIRIARNAEKHILNALEVINKNFDKVNDKVQQQLTKHRSNWTLSSRSIKLRILEPIAKNAMLARDFITALDTYKRLNELQDEVYNFTESSSIPEVYKRIEKANYLAAKASFAISHAGVYLAKTDSSDYDKEILEQFLIAYRFTKESLAANPEQLRYKEGLENVFNNTVILLKKNPSKWLEYLIEFPDPNLKIIMQKTDLEKYKREQAKIEIENNGIKKFFLMGSFWIGLLFIVYYMVTQLAESNIVWYRFVLVLFAIPVLFTVVGAFALRSTNSLKEENFIKLMNLALKINLQGLKILSSNREEKDKS